MTSHPEAILLNAILRTDEMAMLIPIIAVIMGCSIPIVLFTLDFFKKRHFHQLMHKERLAAIERGMEPAPWPEGLFEKRFEETGHPRRHLRRGLVLLFLGLALTFALYESSHEDFRRASYGLIPVGIGLANLLYYAIEGRRESAEWQARQKQQPAPSNPTSC